MNSNNNSFSIFLNIVLGLFFIGSIVFSYFFGNFGGISIKELNDNYMIKDELSFKDLPQNIQKKYIDRDQLKLMDNSNETIKKAFDDEGNPLVIEAEDADDFNKIVKSLQERIIFLEKENIFLSNDKDELLKIVEHEKSKNNTDQKSLVSNNLEKLNEAEQQHYENISQLTMKINDLQRENISLSQQINGKNDALKVRVEELEARLVDEKKKALVNQEKALESQKLKYSNLENEKKSLQEQLDVVRQNLELQKSNNTVYLGKKDQQITMLQDKINQLMMEKNNILIKNSQDALEMEKRNSKKLQEFSEIIKNNSLEKEAIKKGYLEAIEKLEKKYNTLVTEQKEEINSITVNLQKEKQNSITVLENSENMLLKKEVEYKKDLGKSREVIKILNNKVKSIEDENKALLSKLETQNTTISLGQDKVLQLQDKIKTLDKNDRNLDDEVRERVKINEEKHNINYKILNEKIANLEQELKTKNSSNSKNISALKNEKAELVRKINIAHDENTQKNQQIAKLKDEISMILKQKNNLELNENEKLTKIKKSFDSLQEDVIKQEKEYNNIVKKLKKDVNNQQAEYSNIINKLKNDIENQENEYSNIVDGLKKELVSKDTALLERAKDKEKLGKYVREITYLKKLLKTADNKVAIAKTNSLSKKSKKLVKVDSIECDDMNSGNFKISSTCKAKVDKFLNQYSENDFFEIIPIVGTGGFASLNLIKRKSKLGIADGEIERLTGLANLGLGKHRAKEAGWLIKEKFGDNAKISYTVYNIEAQNKRGFVIRVYR